jgi:excisionase family DNA binding protein
VSTLSPEQSERERAIKLMRARKNARQRRESRLARRAAAVETGKALYVSVSEAAVLTGLSVATIYRRVADGTFTHKKITGRVLIERSQLG